MESDTEEEEEEEEEEELSGLEEERKLETRE